jgi:integration host factor subunit beta
VRVTFETVFLMAGNTLTKREPCQRVAASAGCIQAAAGAIVQQLLDELVEELARGNRLEFRGFGVFGTHLRGPKTARNPRTDEAVAVPAKAVVRVKAGKEVARKVQQALPHLGES